MKIDMKKTILVTFIMLLLTITMNFLPLLVLLIMPFMLLPTVYLYVKSRKGFYLMSAIVIGTSIFMSIFTMQIMMSSIFAGYIVGQLLIERTSKERILYILTVFYSIYSLISIIFLQMTNYLPQVATWFKPTLKVYNDYLSKEIDRGVISSDYLDTFNMAVDSVMLQVPGVIIFMLFALALLQIIIAMPILRNFKVATPNFRPLYAWQMPKMLLYVYFIAVIISLFLTEENYITLGIVINLKYVIEWIIFIQGLSVLSYLMKMKRAPVMLNILMFMLAVLLMPVTKIFGMIDMMINLKKRITRR